MCVYAGLARLVPEGATRGHQMPLELTDGCELSRECWDLNPQPLEEQSVL